MVSAGGAALPVAVVLRSLLCPASTGRGDPFLVSPSWCLLLPRACCGRPRVTCLLTPVLHALFCGLFGPAFHAYLQRCCVVGRCDSLPSTAYLLPHFSFDVSYTLPLASHYMHCPGLVYHFSSRCRPCTLPPHQWPRCLEARSGLKQIATLRQPRASYPARPDALRIDPWCAVQS